MFYGRLHKKDASEQTARVKSSHRTIKNKTHNIKSSMQTVKIERGNENL